MLLTAAVQAETRVMKYMVEAKYTKVTFENIVKMHSERLLSNLFKFLQAAIVFQVSSARCERSFHHNLYLAKIKALNKRAPYMCGGAMFPNYILKFN